MKRVDDKRELIPATWGDVIRLYCLRNEEQTRINSFDTRRIFLAKHILWYSKFMHNPDIIVYFLKINNRKIGYVRLTVNAEKGKISYSIDYRYRNRGYGLMMISMLEKEVIGLVSQLEAAVKKDNVASNRIFQRLNYEKFENESGYCYVKKI